MEVVLDRRRDAGLVRTVERIGRGAATRTRSPGCRIARTHAEQGTGEAPDDQPGRPGGGRAEERAPGQTTASIRLRLGPRGRRTLGDLGLGHDRIVLVSCESGSASALIRFVRSRLSASVSSL